MELFFLSITSMIAVLFFSYFFLKNKQNKVSQTLLEVTQAELKSTREKEHQLNEELLALQTKLNNILEDPVTNLLGWKLFEDRLAQSIKESERYQLTLGVLFIDIDDFKTINDTLGYEIGDALLQEVAERLKSCIRKVDSLSRFAKDTFVILLLQLAKPETAAIVAQRVLQALAEPFRIKDHELYVTASLGISIFPVDGQDAPSLLRSASHALHLAKDKGKHMYQFYQEKLYLKSQRDLMLYTGLNQESIFQEFIMYYQPIVNVGTESVVCIDTLLYWQHTGLGLIHPQEVWNSAEKQLKTNIITEWVLKNVCKQFKHWRAMGFYSGLLGVPLGIKQLENSHFIYRISQILQELEFKPEWLLFQLQNTTTQLPFDALEKAFNMLNFMGVKIAIDHFGVGMFSLLHLKNLPVEYLRLDPALTQDVVVNQQAATLIKSLVVLARSIGMQVVVQEVESEQQMLALREIGCKLMQGQFLGAPMLAEEMTYSISAPTS